MGTYFISILVVIGLSLVGVFGDYFIKLAGHSDKYIIWWQFLLGLIIYSATLKFMTMAKLGILALRPDPIGGQTNLEF